MNIKEENSCIIIHTYHGLNKGYIHMLNTKSNFTGAVIDDIKFEQDKLPSEDDPSSGLHVKRGLTSAPLWIR